MLRFLPYVVAGELEHEDSTGNGARIKAGDFQYMSAGSGIYHSERNPSTEHPTELYQIWMKPNQVGGEPRYSETHTGELHNQVKLLFRALEERITRSDKTPSFTLVT